MSTARQCICARRRDALEERCSTKKGVRLKLLEGIMLRVSQVLAVIFVAVAFALSLAHALELPGKMRLDRGTYYAVQPIYYPGFTIGGISEPVAVILTIALLILTPFGGAEFWLTLIALMGLLAQQIVFWFVTQPVNQFWVKGQKLNRLSFFSFGRKTAPAADETTLPDWKNLRDRWEYSHVVRAGLALTSLIALVIALSVRS